MWYVTLHMSHGMKIHTRVARSVNGRRNIREPTTHIMFYMQADLAEIQVSLIRNPRT
jgi:hypothetical protein